MVEPLDGASLVKLCEVNYLQPLVKRNLGLVECSQLRQLSPISLMRVS